MPEEVRVAEGSLAERAVGAVRAQHGGGQVT